MGSEGYKALIAGLIMLFVFGGFLPLIVSQFTVESSQSSKYSSALTNFAENGIDINIPVPFFSDIRFTFNPISWFGSTIQNFIVGQAQGFSLIPDVIGIPLIILTIVLIIYGLVKMVLP